MIIMSLMDKLNILNKNVDEDVSSAIKEVRKQLDGLYEERTCKIYNSYLYNELKKRHVHVRLINTNDLNIGYEHYFVLILTLSNRYFIGDLTYSQFNSSDFIELVEKGFMRVDDDRFNKYLNIISNRTNTLYRLEDVYFMVFHLKRQNSLFFLC